MRRFSLYRRGRVFYVQFWNQQARCYASGISTRQLTRNAALATVATWQTSGIEPRATSVEDLLSADTAIRYLRGAALTYQDARRIVEELDERGLLRSPDDPSSESLVSFLTRFWDYEHSPYVADLHSHKHAIGRRHCYDMTRCVENHWKPFFADRALGSISKTANNVLTAGTVALNWAHGEQIIPTNPGKDLRKYGSQETTATRGVLTVEEARSMLSLEWSDERFRVATLVAMTTGLRAGEIAALRVEDIAEDRLYVRHAWSNQDGLKSTKTGTERVVPLLPSVRRELKKLAQQNPHGESAPRWCFWSTVRADRPVDPKAFGDAFRRMLPRIYLNDEQMGDAELLARQREQWNERGVVFHSSRHLFATRLSAQLDERTARTATGHATREMFEHYARHHDEQTFQEVAKVTRQAFGFLSA